ncbi:MAG: acylneuraminate cytidylyltransferase [Candidatus Lokiarchaeota archaeon]|nr:acylneuraminate cytidylyltransferase [Candidatus Lokiarchaeota archaeon]
MIGAIIQARSSSRRFPNKVLKELPMNSGISVLAQIIRRVKLCKRVEKIIVATTDEKEDEAIVEIAQKEGVDFFKGDLNDVLSRFYNAAARFGLDHVVRITGDCPCIDPTVIDELVSLHLSQGGDYSSNVLERSFIHGLDTEIVTFPALKEAFLNATEQYDREHVMPYFYKSHPDSFKLVSLKVATTDPNYAPDIRVTLDTEDDYITLAALYDFLFKPGHAFNSHEIIQCFSEHPWLRLINKAVLHKKKINTLENEFEEAVKLLDLQGLNRVKEKILTYKAYLVSP